MQKNVHMVHFFSVTVGREKEDGAEKTYSKTEIIPNLKTIPRSSMNSKLQITSQ